MSTKTKKPKQKYKKHYTKHMVVGNKIKEFREIKGLEQGDLAVIAGVTKSHMSKIENGDRKQISLPVAMRLAKSLNTSK